ncbi:hypothetical protein J2T57_001597 [Natronocella acetinitrilica]|uniref:Uncharacterized protein n=1 Tax=Natronocella acetinitrilica TaxID=414046 RepID=A0AAE3KAL9_9GAMM|nr:hypothetical protein [Natronocella acetinitrilica]MCP1674495.1 hypothetical protein [Natronocella acetinitrilica]
MSARLPGAGSLALLFHGTAYAFTAFREGDTAGGERATIGTHFAQGEAFAAHYAEAVGRRRDAGAPGVLICLARMDNPYRESCARRFAALDRWTRQTLSQAGHDGIITERLLDEDSVWVVFDPRRAVPIARYEIGADALPGTARGGYLDEINAPQLIEMIARREALTWLPGGRERLDAALLEAGIERQAAAMGMRAPNCPTP